MSPCYQNLRIKAPGQRGEGKEVEELDTQKMKGEKGRKKLTEEMGRGGDVKEEKARTEEEKVTANANQPPHCPQAHPLLAPLHPDSIPGVGWELTSAGSLWGV